MWSPYCATLPAACKCCLFCLPSFFTVEKRLVVLFRFPEKFASNHFKIRACCTNVCTDVSVTKCVYDLVRTVWRRRWCFGDVCYYIIVSRKKDLKFNCLQDLYTRFTTHVQTMHWRLSENPYRSEMAAKSPVIYTSNIALQSKSKQPKIAAQITTKIPSVNRP